MQTTPRRYQQLQPEDRVTMASLLQQNHSLRDIAAVLNRAPSTSSRQHRHHATRQVSAVGVSPSARAMPLKFWRGGFPSAINFKLTLPLPFASPSRVHGSAPEAATRSPANLPGYVAGVGVLNMGERLVDCVSVFPKFL